MKILGTALRIVDRMTAPLRNITNAMDTMMVSLCRVHEVSDDIFDPSTFSGAQEKVNQTRKSVEKLTNKIHQTGQGLGEMNHEFDKANTKANLLEKTFKKIALSVGGMMGVKKILNLSDEVVTVNARLNLLTGGDAAATKQLQSDIYQSAQRARAPYQETAEAISKMGIMAGQAFSSNTEIVAFMEQVNKQFAIAGTAPEGMKAAMLQLTQAMGMGVLRGEELNSIFEQAPTIMQAIADYLDIPIGKVRELASEGGVTSSIVKNALLSVAEETNQKFEAMPATIGQIGGRIASRLLMTFQPVLVKLNEIANSKGFGQFVNVAIQGFSELGNVASGVLDFLVQGASFVAQNWGIIGPIIGTATGALLLYQGAVLAVKSAEMIGLAIKGASAVATIALALVTRKFTKETTGAAAAQLKLNAAILANPIFGVIAIIIAVVGAIYLVIGVINTLTGKTISATGIILGILFFAGAVIGNLVLTIINFFIDGFVILYNAAASVAEFFANVWFDPIGAVIRLFADLCDFVLGVIYTIANALDTVLGSHLADTVKGWQDDFKQWVSDTVGENEIKIERFDPSKYDKTRIKYGDAFGAGNELGKKIDEKVKAFFNPAEDLGEDPLKDVFDPTQGLSDLAQINENTGAIKDSLDMTNEELKYMRDVAEQEAINRFTTAEISVNMSNQNHINSKMDIDGVIDRLFEKVDEAVAVSADGVHN